MAPKRKKRVVLPLLLVAALGGGAYEGYGCFVEGRFLVSTDDAYVKADMSTITAKVAGYVSLVPVTNNAVDAAKADATREAAEFDRADSLMHSSYGTQQKLDAARAERDLGFTSARSSRS